MTPLPYLSITAVLVLACVPLALLALRRASRRLRAQEIAAKARR